MQTFRHAVALRAAHARGITVLDSATTQQPGTFAEVIILDGVLSREECEHVLSRAAAAGYVASKHKGHENSGYRRGSRAPLTDPDLARLVFARISSALPVSVRPDSMAISRLSEAMLRMEPSWGPACGLWEQLRVLAYNEGDYFRPHLDNRAPVGSSIVWPDASSFLTMLLYLQDPAEPGSGATRFRCHSGTAPVDPYDGDLSMHRPGYALAECWPALGRVVLFPHRLVHEGRPVAAGCTKYVMRGDVLYSPPRGEAKEEGSDDEEDEDSDQGWQQKLVSSYRRLTGLGV